jgi:hypothetical protein
MLVGLIKSQRLFASLKLWKCGRFARVEAPFKSSVSIVTLYPEIGEEFEASINEQVPWPRLGQTRAAAPKSLGSRDVATR